MYKRQVLDQGMENGITGQLISVTNSGTMTGTEKQAIDLRYMINTSATITNLSLIHILFTPRVYKNA